MSVCPICNKNDRRCKLTDMMAICHNSDGTGHIDGFVATEASPKGKGWVWEPAPEFEIRAVSDRGGDESRSESEEFEDIETAISLTSDIAELKGRLLEHESRSPESIRINKQIGAKEAKLKVFKEQAKHLKKSATAVGVDQIGPLVEANLYSDRKWICYLDELYYWTGNYYKKSPDDAERPKISSFCKTYSYQKKEEDGSFSEVYPFRETRYIIEALKWVKFQNEISQDSINPPGFNCKNGVIECNWNGDNFNDYKFVQHDPSIHVYLTPPNIDYNPDANPCYYNKLMECLEPEFRDIWEKTVAAAFDLKNIRMIKGSRTVRALLLKGDGSNGKDTLKILVQSLFGKGKVSSCSFSDFKQYEEGNRFNVSLIHNKAINWPSENSSTIPIDGLEVLKNVITGDTISIEKKGKDAIEYNPQIVCMFNINKGVDLMTQLTALESRWAIIPFNKSYVDNPKNIHELQADPRFREDDRFIQENLAPAFLNRLLDQLQSLAIEGIDYSPTKEIMTTMQQQACHLMQFCADTGLQYAEGQSVQVKTIWDKLEQWYVENDYLIRPTLDAFGKNQWTATGVAGDRLVKGPNQVAARFMELFPKAKKFNDINPGTNAKITMIQGIAFC
jgi:putative DNA primase/helicase